MRIAIVDDLETERAQLKTRLARQLRLRGAEAARAFSPQKKSSALPPRFWIFTCTG